MPNNASHQGVSRKNKFIFSNPNIVEVEVMGSRITLAARRLEELFSSCAVVSVFRSGRK